MKKQLCLTRLVCVGLLLLGAGCGGGGGGGGSGGGTAGADSGTASISISQVSAENHSGASEQVVTFEVDVSDISFIHSNGRSVSVLSRTTRTDLATLESISDLFIGASLRTGSYTGMTMTLDFSNAVVLIEGQSTPAAVVDRAGNPITGSVPVHVEFAGHNRPEIHVSHRHIFELELDLNSALTVDQAHNSVTFDPVLIARVDASHPKPVAVHGLLDSVDVAHGTFEVQRRAEDDEDVCLFTVSTTDATVFQVDGVPYVGSPGLTAMAALLPGRIQVFARGTRGEDFRGLVATAVEAGAGTCVRGQSWVEGSIVGRDSSAGQDAALTVLGSSHDAVTGARRFNTQYTVAVHLGSTRVLRRDSSTALTTDVLDVGQRVIAFGTLSGTALDATGTSTTPGIVRMLVTNILGTATGPANNNVLTINAARFDRLDVSNFHFTVGGIAEADPHAYTVDVTGLSTTGVDTDLPVRVSGWVNPVGVASDDNFRAVALTARTTTEAGTLLCEWSPASAQAVSGISSTQITLDVTHATTKVVDNGVAPVTLADVPAPTLVPLGDLGFYVITQNDRSELHLHFDTFATSLQTRVGAGAMVRRVSAGGRFDAAAQALTALTVTIVVE